MSEILIVNNAESGITEFTQPLEKLATDCGYTSLTVEYPQCIELNFDHFSGVILSGSPQGDDIVEHHAPYFKWLLNYDRPVLGICAGHHVTGYLYGSELLRSVEPESGDFQVDVVKNDPVLKGLPSNFRVKQMHNDSITLPGDFELLLTAETCKNQMMKHKSRSLYTCQFHPEFYNHDLIRNFIRLCKKENH